MKRTIVTLVDDLDNTELAPDGGETVTFSLDGKTYELDLSHDNAKKMRDQLGMYVKPARLVNLGSQRRGTGRTRQESDRVRTQTIREWAEFKGMLSPGARGRIPNAVVEAWESRSPAEKVADDTAMRQAKDGQTTIETPKAEPKAEPKATSTTPPAAPNFKAATEPKANASKATAKADASKDKATAAAS